MLTCREMSELGSQIIDRQLGLQLRMAVSMHLGMCRNCRRYVGQLRLASQVLQQLPPDDEAVDAAAILAKVRSLGK